MYHETLNFNGEKTHSKWICLDPISYLVVKECKHGAETMISSPLCSVSQRELAIGLHVKYNKIAHTKKNTNNSSAI